METLGELLDLLVAGVISEEQNAELRRRLKQIEADTRRPDDKRMAALLLRASLAARAAHV